MFHFFFLVFLRASFLLRHFFVFCYFLTIFNTSSRIFSFTEIHFTTGLLWSDLYLADQEWWRKTKECNALDILFILYKTIF